MDLIHYVSVITLGQGFHLLLHAARLHGMVSITADTKCIIITIMLDLSRTPCYMVVLLKQYYNP